MPKINRLAGNVPAFASEATTAERRVFASTTRSDSLDANAGATFRRGAGAITPVNGERPLSMQNLNGSLFTISQMIAYLFQAGVAEWQPSQEYYYGAAVSYQGRIYIRTSTSTSQDNSPPPNSSRWERIPYSSEIPDLTDEGLGQAIEREFLQGDIINNSNVRNNILAALGDQMAREGIFPTSSTRSSRFVASVARFLSPFINTTVVDNSTLFGNISNDPMRINILSCNNRMLDPTTDFSSASTLNTRIGTILLVRWNGGSGSPNFVNIAGSTLRVGNFGGTGAVGSPLSGTWRSLSYTIATTVQIFLAVRIA